MGNRGLQRLVYIDILEALAIFFVLIYHSTIYKCDIISDNRTLFYLRYLFGTILSTGVPLFFLANGYLLFSRSLDLKKHIIKTIRFIFLAIVWGGVKILILMLIRKENLSLFDIIKVLVTWKQGWINSLWYLGTLVCIYVLYPLLKLIYDTNKKIFRYFLIVCFIFTFGNVMLNNAGTIFLNIILHKNIIIQDLNFFSIFNPFTGARWYAFVYFCVGGCLYNYKERIFSINKCKRNLVAITAICISSLALWGVGVCYSKASGKMWDVVWNGYDTIFTFINVICIFVLCLNYNKDTKLIRVISCNTLGIYFMHELFIQLTRNRIVAYNFFCNIPMNLIYAISVLVMSLIATIIIGKIPVLKKLV